MKNFNKMTRGEKAYAMNEVVSALNCETAYYSDWLDIWPDEATLKESKEYFDEDDNKDSFDELSRKFKIRVEMFGCKDGYSIEESDVDGLYVPCTSDPEDEEDERGGGFYFCLDGKLGKEEAMKKALNVRHTLTTLDYPLTENSITREGKDLLFYIDHKKWRAQKAAAFIKESIEWLLKEEQGCCTIRLSKATQLAVGWENGFDPKDESVIHSKQNPSWVIVMGIKALYGDDMKTDFEWLTTPYVAEGDEENTVFSSLEMPLSPNSDYEKVFSYLIDEYNEILKDYVVKADGRCLPRAK